MLLLVGVSAYSQGSCHPQPLRDIKIKTDIVEIYKRDTNLDFLWQGHCSSGEEKKERERAIVKKVFLFWSFFF